MPIATVAYPSEMASIIDSRSSDDTAGIPMSRPEQYGDRLYQNEQEYAERTEQVERGVQRAENEATSSFRGDFARRALQLVVEQGRLRRQRRARPDDAPGIAANDSSGILWASCNTC